MCLMLRRAQQLRSLQIFASVIFPVLVRYREIIACGQLVHGENLLSSTQGYWQINSMPLALLPAMPLPYLRRAELPKDPLVMNS